MNDFTVTEAHVRELFGTRNLSAEESRYLNYHAKRLAYTTHFVQSVANQSETPLKILDVGPHFLSFSIKNLVQPRPLLYTMGFANYHLFPESQTEKHIELDLNECESLPENAIEERFDLIVISETIEHLYTSPKIIFAFLAKLLTDNPGAGILVQTPNAVNIYKRIKMLLGRNPYELIRTDRTNPGHFREYTMNELIDYGQEAGFTIGLHEYCSYWPIRNPLIRVMSIIPSFKEGISIFLKK
ncbi:MAG: hypothetical protein HYU71_08790 [Bacteroidetes bacterium]|nr:hypothetical protein [Bacteroidota bacterium]